MTANPSSLGRLAVSGIKTTLLGQWSRFAIQALGIVILARILTPNDFGLFGMVAAITGLAAVLGDFGLSAAAIQAREISQYQRSNLFWINTAIGLSASIVLVFLSNPISQFYRQPDLRWIVLVLSFNFLIISMSTQYMAEASRTLRFGMLARLDVVAQGMGLVAAISTGLAGWGVWALVSQQIAITVTTLVFIVFSVRWKPSFPRRAPMRNLLTFGANTFGIQVLNYLTSSMDSVLIGRSFGAAELGVYDRAYQLFRMPTQQIATPLTRVMLPILSRVQDDIQSLNFYLRQAQLALAYVAGGLMAILAVFSMQIVELALGAQWRLAGPILAILSIGGFFQSLGYTYHWAFMSTAKTGIQLRFSIVSRILMIGIIFAGVPFGVKGVAAAVSMGLLFNWILLSVFAVPKTGVHVASLVRVILRPLALHLGMVALIGAYQMLPADIIQPGILKTIIGIVIMAVYYSLSFLIIKTLRKDMNQLVTLFRKK